MIAEGLVIASLATSVDPLIEARRARVRYYRRVAQKKDREPVDVGPRIVRTITIRGGPSFDERWSWLPLQWQQVIIRKQ